MKILLQIQIRNYSIQILESPFHLLNRCIQYTVMLNFGILKWSYYSGIIFCLFAEHCVCFNLPFPFFGKFRFYRHLICQILCYVNTQMNLILSEIIKKKLRGHANVLIQSLYTTNKQINSKVITFIILLTEDTSQL